MSESFLLLDGYEALGTTWYLEVFEELLEEKKEIIRSEIAMLLTSFGAQYSRFKKDSLLNELNTKRSISYDEHLAKMLTLGEEAYIQSDGNFNLFVKDALEQKGYGEKNNTGLAQENENTLPSKENKRVVITRDTITLLGNLSVDLGGIGKEYLLDHIASLLKNTYKVEQFLLNGGGDMYATHFSGAGIEVYMQHPEKSDEVIGSLILKNQAFCSSSSFVRSWSYGDSKRNHFVTRNGEEVWVASFAVGSTTTSAGVVATTACIVSLDVEMCEKLSTLYSLLCYVCSLQRGCYFW